MTNPTLIRLKTKLVRNRNFLASKNKPNILSAAIISLIVASIGVHLLLQSKAATFTYPTTPPAQICGNASILGNGPTTAPAGSVTVPAGDLYAQGINTGLANITYW